MLKLKKFTTAIIVLCVLSVISAAALLFNYLTPKGKSGFDYETLASQFGTITLDTKYSAITNELTVKQSTEYLNKTGKYLTSVMFHLYANAYKKNAQYPPVTKNEQADAYPNGLSFGDVTITDSSNNYLIEGTDNTFLTVYTDGILPPNKSAALTMEYTVKLANIKHRLGYTDDFVNLGQFYAIPAVYENEKWIAHTYSTNGDPFYNDLYNYDVSIDVPANYTVAHSGEEITPNRYRAYAIRDFAMVLSKKFQVLSQTVGDTEVIYYYTADPIAEASLQTAVLSLQYFSQQFMQYPYKTLAVVQTDFLHGGMEYGSLVYISRDVTDTIQYQTVIIHEIAHQWWYGIVGNQQTQTAWIDEGLAEYSTAIFFEHHPQYGVTIDKLAAEDETALSWYREVITSFGGKFDESLSRDLNDFNSSYEYTFCAYSRGFLLFYTIAKMAGYDKFNSALSLFAKENRYTFGTKDKLITSLETSLNTKLKSFFDKYIAGQSANLYS
jgi:hypothetical protein